jgi:16S rRNA processing protein RimM
LLREVLARWVALAEVTRPHGVWGEVRLKVYNADSELLFSMPQVLVRSVDDASVMELESLRGADAGHLLAKFRGIEGRDAADRLRGATLCVERERFPKLDAGEFYVCDVIGAKIVGPGGDLGVVQDLVSYPTADALLVKLEVAGSGEQMVEIPLLDEFVDVVDPLAGKVVLRSEAIDWLCATGAKLDAN